MFDDVKYFNFDEKKDLIEFFFKLMFDWRKNGILNFLDGYINFEGNAINEDLFIDFSSEFSKEDEEYFGEDKVAFYYIT